LETTPKLTIYIVSLFPQLFDNWLQQGVVSRAIDRGLVQVLLTNLRDFGVGRHRLTDDYRFGGGPGMVMKPEPLFDAVSSLGLAEDVPIILLSPQGGTFDQRVAERLSSLPRIVFLAGHYEGVDQRVREHLVTQELSIGDYVLSSGELVAMVVADAVVRLLPEALADGSASDESFSADLLEYPQYTRPANFRGWKVPDVLVSGHHAEIARWRRLQALRQTFARRPDLLEQADLSAQEREMVDRWEEDSRQS
jgi:tRNA (guanine37-N1)-methyltransferase